MRFADCVTGLLLAATAVALLGRSLVPLRRTLADGDAWYRSSGLLPAIVSTALLLCALLLCRRALRQGGLGRQWQAWLRHMSAQRQDNQRTALVFAWLGAYLFVLLPLMPYSLATFIFLFCLMAVFSRRIIVPCLGAGCVACALTLIFSHAARIPLP